MECLEDVQPISIVGGVGEVMWWSCAIDVEVLMIGWGGVGGIISGYRCLMLM